MTDKKLTDNEIIKVLECCPRGIGMKCEKCPMCRTNDCMSKLHVNTLDLITRQQTENENLKVENQSLRAAANSLKMHYEEAQAEIERLKKEVSVARDAYISIQDRYEHAKTEAYKECVEKVKEKASKTEYVCSGALVKTDYTITEKELDNIIKETETERGN